MKGGASGRGFKYSRVNVPTMMSKLVGAARAVPGMARKVLRLPRAPRVFRRNFAADIGVVNLVVGEILPRETIEMLNMVAFEPGDPSAKALRSYIQAIAIEMAGDGDPWPLYDAAMDGGLNATDRGLLVRAVLEMQGRELRLL